MQVEISRRKFLQGTIALTIIGEVAVWQQIFFRKKKKVN